MRHPRKSLVVISRRKRRAIFVALLMATSPATAGEPRSNAGLELPLLPLQSNTSRSAQSHPFCEPESAAKSVPIQLTSGGGEIPSVRLLPIGAAIGLQPIRDDGQARQIQPPMMKIEPLSPPSIQKNPLIQSKHHVDRPLVDAEVADVSQRCLLNHADVADFAPTNIDPLTTKSSTIVLLPVTPIVVAPVTEAFPAVMPKEEIPRDPSVGTRRETEPVHDSVTATGPVSEPEIAEPICFSFSDDFESNGVNHEVSNEVIAEISELDLATDEDACLKSQQDELVALSPPISISECVTQPVDVQVDAAPLTKFSSHVGDMPLIQGPVLPPEPTLHNQRYRSPVAVTPVPLAFERHSNEESVQVFSAVDADEQAQIGFNTLDRLPGNTKLTRLYLSRAQVRSLTIGGEVRNVKVADQSICQAFSAGPNQLKLIGTGNGVTRLVVWAAPDGAESAPLMRAFEVHVNDSVDAAGDLTADRTAMLNQSIRRAFPNSDVAVKQQRDTLVVSGRCDSEATAKKIIRMVRKTCLVPVQDELLVR